MVHNHDHAGVKRGGGAKLGSPPSLVAPLLEVSPLPSYGSNKTPSICKNLFFEKKEGVENVKPGRLMISAKNIKL